MEYFPFTEFIKEASLPRGNFRAVAIASSSLVDVCKVGQNVLGVGSVIPIRGGETLTPVRGFRTGTIGGAAVNQECSTLVLACYEPDDAIVPLGPRAPAYVSRRLTSTVAAQLAFRIPMAGRRQATVWWKAVSPGAAGDQLMTIRRVRYLPLDFCKANLTAQPYEEQDLTGFSFFGGAGAYPSATVVGGGELVFTGSPVYLGNQMDMQTAADFGIPADGRNGHDEIEVWLSGAAGTDMIVEAEARGERGA